VKIPDSILLEEGGEWPRRWGWPWGLAWRDWETLRAVILPVPLNLIAGAARWLYYRVLQGIGQSKMEKAQFRARYFEKRVKELYRWRELAKEREEKIESLETQLADAALGWSREIDKVLEVQQELSHLKEKIADAKGESLLYGEVE